MTDWEVVPCGAWGSIDALCDVPAIHHLRSGDDIVISFCQEHYDKFMRESPRTRWTKMSLEEYIVYEVMTS
jgi:hypothetical protein